MKWAAVSRTILVAIAGLGTIILAGSGVTSQEVDAFVKQWDGPVGFVLMILMRFVTKSPVSLNKP